MASKTYALIIAKGNSSRLENKNWRDFKGKPMFQWNLEKCLKIFDKVYVSSNNDFILDLTEKLGGIPIKRPQELCEDGVPNIPVFRHAYNEMEIKPEILMSIQANSPTIKEELIREAKVLMEQFCYKELITCDTHYNIYGSIWAMTFQRLEEYKDFYSPEPEILLVDPSTDIHTIADLKEAEKWQ